MNRPVRHSHSAARARGVGRTLLASALSLFGVACSDSSTPVAPVGHLSLGKGGGGGGGPSVNAASPAYSRRDTTLNVRILGSGFTSGASADWTLGGVANPAKIKTNSVQYVSSSELIANVTVSADADLAFWDITVTLIGGKKGVGTEKFEVTSATILGAGTIGGDMRVEATNDIVSVVGYGGAANAFVYDSHSSTLVALGPGQAWGIDPSGTMALGRDGDFMPVVWVRGINGWTRQALPGGGNDGIATRAAVAPDGALLASGWLTIQVSRRESNNKPVLWRHANGAWDPPVYYVVPGNAAAGYDVAAGGQMAGRVTLADGSVNGIVWDSPTTATVLDGLAYGISDNGTIVVGERLGRPVYWYRDAVAGWSTIGTALPTLGGSCNFGRARDVTNSGIIVGSGCAPNGKRQATAWKLDLSGGTPGLAAGPIGLGGLGVMGSGAETSFAPGVTSVPPYVAVGGAVTNGGTVLVSWQIP